MSANEMQAMADDAARARARLIASGENIRAQLSPATLTRQMEQTVKSGARHFAGEVKRDVRRHSGLVVGALVGVGALVFLAKSGVLGRSSNAVAKSDGNTGGTLAASQKPAYSKSNAGFSFRTLAASLGPLAVGYFLGESTRAEDGKPKNLLFGLLQGEMARQLWRDHFGDMQRKLVNSYNAPGMAATVMLGLGLVAEMTKSSDD